MGIVSRNRSASLRNALFSLNLLGCHAEEKKNRSWVGTEVPRGSAVPLKTFLDFQVGELRRKLNLSLGENSDDEEDNG